MKLPDPYKDESAKTWRIHDAARFTEDRQFEADVVIVGTGAGGGTAAEIFSRAGKTVIMVEMGALNTSSKFNLDEMESYATLYQDGMTRLSLDGSISILQGRTVGGSTVVNWTSSFRTPEQTLSHWQKQWNIREHTAANLSSWFELMEQRLGIAPWPSPNANNQTLLKGCEKLGIRAELIPRNVRGCWNLGYCGLGCPTNAKQSMLVSTIPAALRSGATLIHNLQVSHLNAAGGKIQSLESITQNESRRKVTIRAKTVILAAGAIGTPAILLRSPTVPDPYRRTGKRTFLHPTLFSFGRMPDEVNPYHGAPQSAYSDHFQWQQGIDGPLGFKLEAVPLQPAFASVLIRGFGPAYKNRLTDLRYTSGFLALLRDGFHPESQGGSIEMLSDGSPTVDYPINDYILAGAKRAMLKMAEVFFAAGAKSVHIGHFQSGDYSSWHEAQNAINALAFEPLLLRVGSAHVMGGSAMGPDPTVAVVNEAGRHHHVENLYVFDGSIFPTSVGANPQLSIYGLTAKLAHQMIGDGKIYIERTP
ncbi:MAG: GMC family oxidoreductase [Deltaproteobacteria bacterium]|nr:GMC family oxidoreductase [Deltaproteobacteria bacterium]